MGPGSYAVSYTHLPDVYLNMKEAFEWSHSNTFWAPDVVRLKDGMYHLYYCNCQGDAPVSCLGMAVSQEVAGPYINQEIILKSGMGADEEDEDGNLYQAASDPNVVDPCTFYDKEMCIRDRCNRSMLLHGNDVCR